MRKGRPLSARRPLAWRWHMPALAIGLLCGQALGSAAPGAGGTLAAAALLAAPAVAVAHRAVGRVVLLAGAAATVGALQTRLGDARREQRFASVPEDAQRFRGVVVAAETRPGRGGSTWAALEVELAGDGGWYGPGERVQLSVWATRRRWQVGEEVAFRGVPRAPRGFCNDGRDRFAERVWRRGIVARIGVRRDADVEVGPPAPGFHPRALLAAVRDGIAAALERAVADEDARAVLRALVLGDQSRIRPGLRRAYAVTGTAHVLSVSGLHIALVASAAFGAACWLLVRAPGVAGRVLVARVAACLALPPALGYALLSGGATATLRALVMGALGLGGIVLLRRTDAWTALAAAALGLALFDPGIAEDAAFQLSFLAVVGLVLAAAVLPRCRAAVAARGFDAGRRGHRALGRVAAALGASLAATLATAPATAFHFGQVALLGPLANLAVVPLAGGLAVLLGLAGSALLAPLPAAGEVVLTLAGLVLRPVNRLVEELGALPFASVSLGLRSPLDVVGPVASFGALVVRGRGARRALLAAALVAFVLAAWVARAAPLAVRFLDVGQGDATVVQLDGAATLVVDGGGLGGSFDPGERVVLPALRRLGADRVAALVVSHPEHDHYAGLVAVVRVLPVDEAWWTGRSGRGASFGLLIDALSNAGIARRVLAAGDAPWIPSSRHRVAVLHPAAGTRGLSENDASLVLLVRYGASRVLLTGDVEEAAEAQLLRRTPALAATIVKVPHHGSRTSSTRALAARVRPGVAAAMLGARNRFRFPAPEVRERWRALGAAWLQTDRAGEVTVRSDGQLERVTTCRPTPG